MIGWQPAPERPPPRTKAQPETAGLFSWAWRYNAAMRTLLIVCLAGTLFAQSSKPLASPRSGEQEKGTHNEQSIRQDNPPESTEASLRAATPSQAQTEANTGKGNNQSESPWRKYFCKAFGPAYLSNWLLAIFAAVAAGIGLRTLNAIKEQARIARIGLKAARLATSAATVSAKATKTSAEAFMDGARGWLLVEKIEPARIAEARPYFEYVAGLATEMKLVVPYFVFCLRVSGNTPCKILSAGMRFHLAPMKEHDLPPEPDLPERPDYWSTIYGVNLTGKAVDIPDSGKVLAPRERLKMGAELESGSLSAEDCSLIEAHEKFACAYGFVNYEDTFRISHETRFCYIYRVSHRVARAGETGDEVEPSRFRVGGPLAYNRET